MKLFIRKRTRPQVVMILGSGPAGLFAAQAAIDMGGIVSIYSRGERSPLYGAQYLHEPIPGLDCGSPHLIRYTLKGTVAGYRNKVYGPGRDEVKVSVESLNPTHQAWDIRSAYGHAWDRFKGLIRSTEITPQALAATIDREQAADLVVWSIPLMTQCVGNHGFLAKSVWAQGDAPELDRYCSVIVDPWTVVVNGEDAPSWSRASNVFGHRTVEWAGRAKPPVEGIARVNKPLDNRCDCWPEIAGAPVLRVGRYGTWTKGELSHQAYFKTRAALEAM